VYSSTYSPPIFILVGFFQYHQLSLLHPTYTDLFFDSIIEIYQTRARGFADSFFGYLFPELPEDDSVLERTRGLISVAKEAGLSILHRKLRAKLDSLQRARRAIDYNNEQTFFSAQA
jgi:hypothetical protein